MSDADWSPSKQNTGIRIGRKCCRLSFSMTTNECFPITKIEKYQQNFNFDNKPQNLRRLYWRLSIHLKFLIKEIVHKIII